eukprot:gene55735-74426_t
MRANDAWVTMCWTNDGAQLHRDIPEIAYILGSDGGEIWTDFYAIPKDGPNKPAGYALLNFLMDPQNAKKEHLFNGAPSTDSRTSALLPKEFLENKILYPDETLLSNLEFGAAVTLTDPGRAELMARFNRGAAQGSVPARSVGDEEQRMRNEAANRRRLVTAMLVGPAAIWLFVFLVLPFIAILVFSFGERAPEGGYQLSFTFAQYANLGARATAFWNTMVLAPAGALICLIVAYPVAYYLAVKANPRYRLIFVSLIVVPFWT